jgi:hypothetical protein
VVAHIPDNVISLLIRKFAQDFFCPGFGSRTSEFGSTFAQDCARVLEYKNKKLLRFMQALIKKRRKHGNNDNDDDN